MSSVSRRRAWSRRLSLSVIALFLIGGLASSSRLDAWSARLELPDGSAAAGFEVAVVGRSGAVRTDAAGGFRLEPEPVPPYLLVATSPEGQVFAPLEVNPPGVAEGGALRLLAVARDAVTVVAGVAPGIDASPAAAATVLTGEELEQRRPVRLFDAMAGVPGAGRLGEGADSVPAIRGLARGRTLVMIDGARVSAERRVGPSATFLDPEALSSIEIVRGPGSVAYGSDAFGGVVNARTREPQPGRLAGRATLGWSGGGMDERSASAELSVPLGDGALLVALQGRDAEDNEAGGGEPIDNSSGSSHGGAVRYAGPLGPGRLRASLAVDRVEDLGKAASDSNVTRSTYPEELSDRLTLGWSAGEIGGWDSLDALLFVGRYRVLLDRDRLPTSSSNRRIETSDVAARDAGLRFTVGRPFAGGRLRVGLDLQSRHDLEALAGRIDFSASGVETGRQTSVAIDQASQSDGGLFLLYDHAVGERFLASAGLRGDRVRTANRGGYYGDRTRDEDALSGHLALTAGPFGGWTGTVQVARGFRSPTLSDRYFRGPSGRGFVVGNPDLDSERSRQLDATLRWAGRGRSLTLAAYRYRIADLVERYRVGNDFNFRNRGEAELSGVELEGQIQLGGGFELQSGIAWSRGEDADTGERIADVAPSGGSVTLRWAGERAFGYARASGAERFDRPGPAEVERAGWAAFDLGGGWRFGHGLELQALVRNAGDRLYVAAADETATPVPGRSVTVGLSWRH